MIQSNSQMWKESERRKKAVLSNNSKLLKTVELKLLFRMFMTKDNLLFKYPRNSKMEQR